MTRSHQKIKKTLAALVLCGMGIGWAFTQPGATPGAGAQLNLPEDDSTEGGSPNTAPDGVITAPVGNITVHAGDTVQFAGTASDSENDLPITEIWTKSSDGQQSQVIDEPESTFFGVPGTYTIIYQVTDARGLADPTPDNRMVNVLPPAPSDSTPPVLSNIGPSGTLPAGTTETQLTVTTDEVASCRYSAIAGDAYDNMFVMSTADGLAHSTVRNNLPVNETQTYYFRCRDQRGNTNGSDQSTQFIVAEADSIPPAAVVNLGGFTVS